MTGLKWMPAKAYGGKLNASVVVVHCTESDNGAGTAESLAGPNWFGGSKAGTSAHKMFDRDSGVEMVRRPVVAYHAGPRGNSVGVSYEFCGRAGWSAAKWREPEQLNMLRLAAPAIAEDLRAIGAPARWLSLAQLAAGARGLCTHNDIRLALGGTTHSDPGPNFPYAELLSYVQAALAGTPIAPAEENDMKVTDIVFTAPSGPISLGRALELLDEHVSTQAGDRAAILEFLQEKTGGDLRLLVAQNQAQDAQITGLTAAMQSMAAALAASRDDFTAEELHDTVVQAMVDAGATLRAAEQAAAAAAQVDAPSSARQ